MHAYIYEVNYAVSRQNVLQWVCRLRYALVPSSGMDKVHGATIIHHTMSVKHRYMKPFASRRRYLHTYKCLVTSQSARNLLQRVSTILNRDMAIFEDYVTFVVSRLKCIISGCQRILISVMEGSLVCLGDKYRRVSSMLIFSKTKYQDLTKTPLKVGAKTTIKM